MSLNDGRPGNGMDRFIRRSTAALILALRLAAGAMLMLSVSINFANIIGRYFLSYSLSWAEEAMLFLMIGCVFLGASEGAWLGRHIRMDVVISLLPARVRKAFDVLADLVTIATCIAVALFTWPVMTMLYELDQRSEVGEHSARHPTVRGADRIAADGASDRGAACRGRRTPRRRRRRPGFRALK